MGQVTLGAQGHCPPAVQQTLRDGTFHRPGRLNLAVGRFLSFPPQKNTPAVPGDSSLPPSCPGAAAVTSVYDTLLPFSPHLPPSPADQMPGRRWELARSIASHLDPPFAHRGPNGNRKGAGVQEGPVRGSPQHRFWLMHCFRNFFPNFPPPCGVHSSQRSRTRNVVIGWAAGPTPHKASGSRIEPLQGWQDMVGAASLPP